MPSTEEALDQFIANYELNTTNCDPAVFISQFASSFLAAGPTGPVIVPAAAFAQKLPSRKEQFDKAGLRSTTLAGRRVIPVSERYILVETQWRMDFAAAGKPDITLTAGSSLLIDMGDIEPKILVYLPHHDIFQLMQDHGLMSPSQ